MSAISVSPHTTSAPPLLWQLTRIEAGRYARHPLFVIGVVLALASSAGNYGPVELDHQVVPAFLIGLLGVVIASRLTSASDSSGSVVASAPSPETRRTAALCLACAVPAAAGIAVVVFHRIFVLADPPPAFEYAGFGATDRFWITMAIPVVASAGGPLLGVAIGRWLRFPGATLLSVLGLLIWTWFTPYVPQRLDGNGLPARALHLLTPYTAFLQTNADSNLRATMVTAYTGSAFWFLMWTIALCAIAATVALLHGAEGRTRQVLLRWLTGAVCIAVTTLVLGVTTGATHLVHYRLDPSTGVVTTVSDGE